MPPPYLAAQAVIPWQAELPQLATCRPAAFVHASEAQVGFCQCLEDLVTQGSSRAWMRRLLHSSPLSPPRRWGRAGTAAASISNVTKLLMP